MNEQQQIAQLRSSINAIDSLSQDGFSEISVIARLALVAMESKRGYSSVDLALALQAIWKKAEDFENCINCEAENLGCNWIDEAASRRRNAQAAQS